MPSDFSKYELPQSRINEYTLRKKGQHCPRWLETETIYVFDFAINQEYLVKRLDLAIHYQVQPGSEWENFKKAVKDVKAKHPTKAPVIKYITKSELSDFDSADLIERILPGAKKAEFCDDFLKVNFDPVRKLPLEALKQAVKSLGSKPSERGNIAKDFGFTGTRNQVRSKGHYGLAIPNLHRGSDEPWVKDIFEFASARFLELASGGFVPDLCATENPTAYEQRRHNLFARRFGENNILEAMRICIVDESATTIDHGDRDNDDRDERYMATGAIAVHLFNDDDDCFRLGIIGYMKKAASIAMEKEEKYGPLIKEIAQYYETSLKRDEAERTNPENMLIKPVNPLQSTRSGMSAPAPGSEPRLLKKTCDPCLDKLAGLNSVGASAALLLITKYMPSGVELSLAWIRWIVAICMCFCYSNKPDHFWFLCYFLERDKNFLCALLKDRSLPPFDVMDAYQVGRYMAMGMFQMDKWLEVHHPDVVPQPRHQPAVNREPSDPKVVNSINFATNLFLMMRYRLPFEADLNGDMDMRFYYEIATAKMCQNNDDPLKSGVYGCGPLTVQHFLAVAGLLGLVDSRYLRHAEIPKSTLVAEFLQEHYGFSDYSHEDDSRELLASLSYYLDITVSVSEELVCRFVKFKNAQFKNQLLVNAEDKYAMVHRYRDSTFLGQSKFEYSCTLKSSRLEIVHGTEDTSSKEPKKKKCKSSSDILRSYYLEDGTLVLRQKFQPPFTFPPNATLEMIACMNKYNRDVFWTTIGLGRSIVKRKAVKGQKRIDVTCKQFYPSRGKKSIKFVQPQEVDPNSIVLPPSQCLVYDFHKFLFSPYCLEKCAQPSQIMKTLFGLEGSDQCFIVMDKKRFNDKEEVVVNGGNWYYCAGIYVGGDKSSEPVYADPAFPLVNMNWKTINHHGRLYIGGGVKGCNGLSEAKLFVLLFYTLKFSRTCMSMEKCKDARRLLYMPDRSPKAKDSKVVSKGAPKARSRASKTTARSRPSRAKKTAATATAPKAKPQPPARASQATKKVTQRPREVMRKSKNDDAAYEDDPTKETSHIDHFVLFSLKGHKANGIKNEEGKVVCGIPKHQFVGVKYKQGGQAYFLVDEQGQRTSGLYLVYPGKMEARFTSLDLIAAGDDKEEEFDSGDRKLREFLRIVNHKSGTSHSTHTLQIQWADSSKAHVPLPIMIQKAPKETYEYAEQTKLLEQDGWKSLKRVGIRLKHEEETRRKKAAAKEEAKRILLEKRAAAEKEKAITRAQAKAEKTAAATRNKNTRKTP